MDKYSLESFERYPAVKCRPAEIRENLPGAGQNAFRTVSVALGGEKPALTEKTLLEIRISKEDTASMAETESALRALAAFFCQHPLVLGVTVCADADDASKRGLWEAAAEAFAPKRYYAPVTDDHQLDYALKRGFLGGVLAVIGDNALDTCEAFARQDAQRLYRRFPVLVKLSGKEKNAASYAAQWHALAAENIPKAVTGFRIALRRLTYPQALSSGGFAPLRFWWTNRGPSFFHGEAEVRLRLTKDGVSTPIPLHDRPDRIPLADRVHNEIARLPQVPPGRYQLEYGLFTRKGEALTLCHAGRTADGYYPASEVTIDDHPRPKYEHIWDDYFEDGYYPLFDPKVPGT